MTTMNKTTVELAEIVLDQTDFEDGGGPYSKGWRSKELDETQAILTKWIKEKCSKN